MKHGVLFGDRVKFDEDSVQQQDEADDDDDPLVLVVNVDDPDCDVAVRPKSKALEVNELIDLTEDDADVGLVYFASSPSHSFDENIVKTEEKSSSSDSDSEMDTSIPATSESLTLGQSEAVFPVTLASELATGIPESVCGIVSRGEINYYFYFKYPR
jgi:hypothetical protein